MKFLFIRLSQYIGIHNGLKRSEIAIDFNFSKHRTILIRGDNGSGKSTIMKSLNIFPDPNDMFVPDKPAFKEMVLQDNGIIYKIKFIHGIKTNGERDTTKAYITKCLQDGTEIQLNENGNVSSYKDIIFNEFDLDSNFVALSQLSAQDRGLADKKPAERKRIVNSIMQTLEFYNSMYKSISKKYNSLKTMVQSLSAKLGSIGDIDTVKLNIESLDISLNILDSRRQEILDRISMQKSTVTFLDPDGTIMERYNTLETHKRDIINRSNAVDKAIKQAIASVNSYSVLDQRAYDDFIIQKETAIVGNQILRSKLEIMIADRDARASQLNQKTQKLSTLIDETEYEKTMDNIAIYEATLKELSDSISQSGIRDASSFTRDEYIMALETLKDIRDQFDTLRSHCNHSLIDKIITSYMDTGTLLEVFDVVALESYIKKAESYITELEGKVIELNTKLDLCKKLDIRPKDCKIDTCPFIADVIMYSKPDLERELKSVTRELSAMREDVLREKDTLTEWTSSNVIINGFRVIVREIDKNKSILSKLPNGGLFTDKARFCRDLISGDYSKYADTIYKYINIANDFDEYNSIKKSLEYLYQSKSMYESKQDYIDEIDKEIRELTADIQVLVNQIDPIYLSIEYNNATIVNCDGAINSFKAYIGVMEEYHSMVKEWNDIEDELNKYKDSLDKINKAIESIKSIRIELKTVEDEMIPIKKEKERLSQFLYLADTYQRELAELQSKFEFVETIRDYSSPTTGIQLAFMELYMGTVINTANQLLSHLFNGVYQIQKFIINESEFRIPCLGEGYLNDDISSMSGAQTAMISMILSFSLLYTSSSRFNIIKLDEIDGSLDTVNRVIFADITDRIMDIMGTEQCFIISHNTEIQSNGIDIIQLKMDNTEDIEGGNIIWRHLI